MWSTIIRNPRQYFYSDQIKKYEIVRACMREKVSVGKPEGKRPLEMPRRRWEDNTRTK
jgi:hypothetical protein